MSLSAQTVCCILPGSNCACSTKWVGWPACACTWLTFSAGNTELISEILRVSGGCGRKRKGGCRLVLQQLLELLWVCATSASKDCASFEQGCACLFKHTRLRALEQRSVLRRLCNHKLGGNGVARGASSPLSRSHAHILVCLCLGDKRWRLTHWCLAAAGAGERANVGGRGWG